jgi:hypothetical protein
MSVVVIRLTAALAVLAFLLPAQHSVRELVTQLQSKDSDAVVRRSAALALGQMGAAAKEAVPPLVASLKSDAVVRRSAALALGQMGAAAKEAVPALVALLVALFDEDSDIVIDTGSGVAPAIVAIAQDAHDRRDVSLIPALKLAEVALVKIDPNKARTIRRNIEFLEAIRPTWHELLIAAIIKDGKVNWSVAGPAAIVLGYLLWLLALGIVLLRSPLTVLRWNEKLAKLDWKLPKWLGEATVPFRSVLLVGLYRDHPRVLDAWVSEHIAAARRTFSDNPTYGARQIYVPLPVVVNGKRFPEVKPEHLQKGCARNRWCMLIRGEGGLGKTTLACRLGFWGWPRIPKSG